MHLSQKKSLTDMARWSARAKNEVKKLKGMLKDATPVVSKRPA